MAKGLDKALNDTLGVKRAIKHFDFSEPYWEGTKQKKLVIANEFNEATGDVYRSGLFEIGLVLLGVTIVVNAAAQLLLKTFGGAGAKPQ